jgi:hypothetical protein
MPIGTNTHSLTHTHIHAHPQIYTHTHTRTRETCESKPLPPQAPRNTTRPINPPRKPFAYQLAVPTPTHTALTNKPAYSHECYPIPTKVQHLSFLSRIPPLAYVSPSHPCTVEPIHSLSHTLQ